MKLLKNFFILVMVISLTACSSDDDSVPYELNNTNLSTGSYGIQYLNIFDTETVNINGLVQPFEIYEELRIEEIKKKHQK